MGHFAGAGTNMGHFDNAPGSLSIVGIVDDSGFGLEPVLVDRDTSEVEVVVDGVVTGEPL